MVEPISGEIKVTITGEGEVPPGVGAPPRAMPGGPTPGDQKKGFKSLQDLGAFGKKMMPFAVMGGVVGILIGLIKRSASFMAAMGAVFDILGAFVDVLLAPFMPLFGALLKLIIPFIPLLQKMAKAIIGPMLAFYEAILEPLTRIVELIIGVVGDVFESVGNELIDLFKNAGSLIGMLLTFVLALPVTGIYVVLKFIQGFVQGLIGNLEGLTIEERAKKITDTLFSMVEKIGEVAKGAGVIAGTVFGDFLNKMIDVANWLLTKGFDYIEKVFNFIDKHFGITTVTERVKGFEGWEEALDKVLGGKGVYKLQTGTPWVPRDMLAFLHKGEAVISAGQNTGRGIDIYAPITVTAYSEVDVAMLGESISSKILETLARELR